MLVVLARAGRVGWDLQQDLLMWFLQVERLYQWRSRGGYTDAEPPKQAGAYASPVNTFRGKCHGKGSCFLALKM